MGKISLYDYLEKYVDIILYFSLFLIYIRMVKEGVRGWVCPPLGGTPPFQFTVISRFRFTLIGDTARFATGCAPGAI